MIKAPFRFNKYSIFLFKCQFKKKKKKLLMDERKNFKLKIKSKIKEKLNLY